MSYTLIAGGYRDTLATLRFTPPSTLEVLSESPAPASPSWVEVRGDKVYTVSEVDVDGEAVLGELKDGKTGVKVLKKEVSGGAPCHIAFDEQDVLVSNYMSGTLSRFAPDLVTHTSLQLPYAYEGKTPPNGKRQEASHAHHALVTRRGVLVCDLGSDRVYVVKDGEVVDWIQCAAGFGPRHAALSEDESTLFVLGELSHTVIAYPFDATKTTAAIPGSEASYLPPGIADTKGMDGAEIIVHKGTVYASNRLQLHADANKTEGAGDSIAIISYTADGRAGKTTHVNTKLCCIRGMTLSPDGKYVAVAGQCKGGVEVYAIEGKRGEEWRKVAEADVQKITDFAWL